MGRSGNEPSTARSPLRLRLLLALFGVALGAAGLAVGLALRNPVIVLGSAATLLVAVVDVAIVLRRLRQGPHYQPGRDVPPYAVPSSPDRGSHEPAVRRPRSESRRLRLYLIMMGTCLGLVAISWVWLRLVSTTAAVIVGVVAMVIPPVAAIVANAGWDQDRHDG